MTARALLVASFGNRQASTAPTQAAVALAAQTASPSEPRWSCVETECRSRPV